MAVTDFLYNSDDEIDKVVLFKEAVIEDSQPVTIPHGLGFTPLLFGVWSENEDFISTRTIGGDTPLGLSAVLVSADATNIYAQYINAEGGSNTAYVRFYGLMPTTETGNAPNATDNVTGFMFSSDYNYTKLYIKGATEAEEGTSIVEHNLGYIPQVMCWAEIYDGRIVPVASQWYIFGDQLSYSEGVIVTNTQLEFRRISGDNTRRHYRIYHDRS